MADVVKASAVFEAIIKVHNIADDRRVAIIGRLKNLISIGFLLGTRVGTGKAATYEREHVKQWALAALMIKVGVRPLDIVRIVPSIIASEWPDVTIEFDQLNDTSAQIYHGAKLYYGHRRTMGGVFFPVAAACSILLNEVGL